MANTFELIASYTATGSVASIDFSSIPSTYTDLIVKFSARASAAYVYQNMFINFNGATTNQTQKVLWVDGATSTTTPYSLSDTRIYGTSLNMASATSNTFSNYEFYIPNYAGSTYKSLSLDGVAENNAAISSIELKAGLWSLTDAINQITLVPNVGSFVIHSTAYLYGVKNA